MTKNDSQFDVIEEKLKSEAEKEKKIKEMKVEGKSVFNIQKIIKEKKENKNE